MMHILTTTTLYPNEIQFRHGIFVEQRLRRLVESGQLNARVIASVPWFPSSAPRFGRYAEFAQVPRREVRWGIGVHHPRYLMIPKIGMLLQPFLLAASVVVAARSLARDGFEFDVIDAHYFYPDGVAAAIVGMLLRKPVTITARGSDINVIGGLFLPRGMIRWAARRAAAVMTVSHALKQRLAELGVDANDLTVLRNGVDLEFFRPADESGRRASADGTSWKLLSIGNLNRAKGHDLVIDSLQFLQDASLTIVGDGEDRAFLEELVRSRGLEHRVTITGSVNQQRLLDYYHAADILVLASEREGMPNVVLEALACGVPVVATAVGGIPEVIRAPAAGVLIEERTAQAVANGVMQLVDRYPDRMDTRRFAEQFGWEDTVRRQVSLYRQVVQLSAGERPETRGTESGSEE